MQNQNPEIQELRNRLVDYLNRYDFVGGEELAERLQKAITNNEEELLTGLGYEFIDPLKAIYYERVPLGNKLTNNTLSEVNNTFFEELNYLKNFLWS